MAEKSFLRHFIVAVLYTKNVGEIYCEKVVVNWLATLIVMVAMLALFKPNFRNMTFSQVGWPKKFQLAYFWPHLKWVGLKKFRLAFWPFNAEKVSSEENLKKISFFFGQHLCKIFVINAILDWRQGSDVGKNWGMRDSK